MSLQIPCPQCGLKLKLPDESFLGRKGKCPQCGNKFRLELPAAEAPRPERIASVRVASPPRPVRPVANGIPVEPVAPAASHRNPTPAEAVDFAEAPLELMPMPEATDDLGGIARLKKMQRRSARMRNITLAAVGVMLVGAALAYAFVRKNSESAAGKKLKSGKSHVAASAKTKSAGSNGDASTDANGLGADDVSDANSDREPIELRALPHGTAIAINLRPAELWQGSELASEVLACLGPIAVWAGGNEKDLGGIIKAYCLAEPAKIEELLVSVIPGPRGTPPDYSFVVRLKQPFKKSDLIEKFSGELQQEPDKPPYYLGQERAYLILDTKTYASCPAKLASEMVENANSQSTTSDGLQAMLPETDRRRQFTVVFEPKDIQAHGEVLVPANAQPLLKRFVEWISNDDEVETVAWSMHLGESFESKLLLRNKKGLSTPPRLERAMQEKLKAMPHDILASVEQMDPQEIGKRKVIGRFPAMTKVFALSTRLSKGERLVAMNTTLPERAAPNLALAGLLAWNETTLPTYGKKPTTVASTASAGSSVSVAERLKKKISVDFRRRPLVDAFNDIGEEIGVTFKMDGDAIKAVGATQNIPQEFKMDDVPATVVIEKIFSGRDRNLGLILVVNEKTKVATVTNPDFAEKRGEKAFPLK
jgi:hypothetical protein